MLSIPEDFELPVSSFGMYGGHASIHIRYDSRAPSLLYRQGDDAPGDNIAYLQGKESCSKHQANLYGTQFLILKPTVGVPGYRISQMVAAGGNILDAYGLVNVISPCGLPMRGIVGISPDPIMFVAINCASVKESVAFYQRLGFAEQVRYHIDYRSNNALLVSLIAVFLRNIRFPDHPKGRLFLNQTSQKMLCTWRRLQIVWVFYCSRRKAGRKSHQILW